MHGCGLAGERCTGRILPMGLFDGDCTDDSVGEPSGEEADDKTGRDNPENRG